MTEKSRNNKKNIAVQKPFLSVGPTLRYSHNNVLFFWTLALLVYLATLMLWSKLLTGDLIYFAENWSDPEKIWSLNDLLRNPINIFNYPEQIIVMGGLMGIIVIVPILISQLMSLRYALPFIIAFAIISLPVGLSIALLISSFAVACRPLRFRSRIVSIALCMLPLIIYWGIFSSSKSLEPIRAAICYIPWVCAWLTAMIIATAVLGIGHFTRYRPGLTFLISFIGLMTFFGIFQNNIGLSELDYQLYVARNNPHRIPEFYEKNISNYIDEMAAKVTKDNSPVGFYPTDQEKLRQQLKKDIQNELRWDRWPRGFSKENKINFQKKRNQLLDQYNKFLHPEKKVWMPPLIHEWLIRHDRRKDRLPIALYYKGIVSELEPVVLDIDQEILRFNSDYSHRGNIQIWVELYKDYGQSWESIEARLRLAKILAREGNLEKAQELCDIGLNMIDKFYFYQIRQAPESSEFFKVFKDPPQSIMTKPLIDDLKFRTLQFKEIIGPQNHNNDRNSKLLLTRFISLNPNELNYQEKLNDLLLDAGKNSPLIDNILLTQALIINDQSRKLIHLKEVSDKYPQSDGAVGALYEMGLLRVQLWQQQTDDNKDIKNNYLHKAREILEALVYFHPNHYLSYEAKNILNSLPLTY